MSFETYQQAVQWVTGLHAHGIKPGLNRMEYFMEKLNNPHRRLKYIHVAGTNGKGSTCAMLDKALRKAGYDVGTFTSPYIEKFTDRITYNGEPIPEADVLQLVNRIKPIADEIDATTEFGYPTMFEICVTMAILYFAEVTYPYYVVWETGLGGRLDCTNIVTPLVSVITNVGMDHTELLGDTVERIAAEKAGIIKPGVPVVTAVEQPEAVKVVEDAASAVRSAVYRYKKQFDFVISRRPEDQLEIMDFVGPFKEYGELNISLKGAHQFKNAAVVVMTLEVLRQYYALILEEDDLRAAMSDVQWPGRFELISDEPRIIADGAHNPEGAAALAAAIRQLSGHERLHIMAGMLANKHHRDYFRHILPIADTIILTQPEFGKAKNAMELKELITDMKREYGLERLHIMVEPDWQQAIALLKQVCEPQDLAVVTGSLYLVADVRSVLLYRSHNEKGW